MGCENRHVEESKLEKAFIMAWNGILENKENFLWKWEEQEKSANLLEVYRAKAFREFIKEEAVKRGMSIDLMLKVLDYIKVFENGKVLVKFMDGTAIECENG